MATTQQPQKGPAPITVAEGGHCSLEAGFLHFFCNDCNSVTVSDVISTVQPRMKAGVSSVEEGETSITSTQRLHAFACFLRFVIILHTT